MDRITMVTSIMNRLGNRTDLQSSIETELTFVQENLLEGRPHLPWFLKSELASTSTTANEERVAVPADFLREIDEQALWLIDPTDGTTMLPLTKDEYDILVDKYPNAAQPQAYSLTNDYFLLKPTPDDVYTLKMRYFQRGATLAADSDSNVWTNNASDLFIAETCLLFANDYLKDTESAQGFASMAQRAWNRIYRLDIARTEAGAMRSMGDD